MALFFMMKTSIEKWLETACFDDTRVLGGGGGGGALLFGGIFSLFLCFVSGVGCRCWCIALFVAARDIRVPGDIPRARKVRYHLCTVCVTRDSQPL